MYSTAQRQPLRFAKAFFLLAALSLTLVQPALARPAAETVLTLAQAERNAGELKRGMSAEEVRTLLGKPKRTALTDVGGTSSATRGALQWTYVWTAGSGPSTLHVDFSSEQPEQWQVRGWEWTAY